MALAFKITSTAGNTSAGEVPLVPHQAISKSALVRISKALPHVKDRQVDTQSVRGTCAPDGVHCLVFFDFWEFHMGVTSARVALVTVSGKVLRVFPFTATSPPAFLSTWSRDSSVAVIGLGSLMVIWSQADERFAIAGVDFSAHDVAWVDSVLTVRESVYRVSKNGTGTYVPSGKGAVFSTPKLKWRASGALKDFEAAASGSTKKPATRLQTRR